jgi:UDP-N-acetyl-2-amino-2-deoxyglucuronate dehydrogenase
MAKLSFGIIGVGRMGKVHAWNLAHARLAGVRLSSVCDTDPKALAWAHVHARHAHAYASYEEMIAKEKLDGVIVVTPHYSHPDIACYALEHGVNVLIEKPLAVTTKEAKRIIGCAAMHPSLKVGVSFNQRSNRVFQKAREIIRSGKLGTIRAASYTITNWYRSDAYYEQNPWRGSYSQEGGGCLINQCVHQLDLIQWIFGLPSSIDAESKTINRAMKAENDVNAQFHYPDFTLNFVASSHDIKGANQLIVSGDKGKLIVSLNKMVAYFHEDEALVNARTKKGYGHAHSKRHVYHYGFFRYLTDLTHGQQLRSLRAFRDEIAHKGSLLAPVKEGLGATMLINAIYLASWTKSSVSLPLDDEAYVKALNKKCEEEKK